MRWREAAEDSGAVRFARKGAAQSSGRKLEQSVDLRGAAGVVGGG